MLEILKPNTEFKIYLYYTFALLAGIGSERGYKAGAEGNTHWEKSVTAAAAVLLPTMTWCAGKLLYRCSVRCQEAEDLTQAPSTASQFSLNYNILNWKIQKSFSQAQRIVLAGASVLSGAILILFAINDATHNPMQLSSSASATPYFTSTNLFSWVGGALMLGGLALSYAAYKVSKSTAVASVDVKNPLYPAAQNIAGYGSVK